MATPNTVIFGTNGKNALFGTLGDDAIYGFDGNDWIMGLDGNDLLVGGEGDDALSGGSGDDLLQGGAGDDRLEGGPGNDRLEGGPGSDILVGGSGADTLIGGPGADTFLVGEFKTPSDQLIGSSAVVNPPAATGPDLIGDFNPLEGDVIDLSIPAEQALYEGLIATVGELAPYVSFVPSESLAWYDPAYQYDLGSTGVMVDLSSRGGDTEVVAVVSGKDAAQLTELKDTILQYEAPVI